MAVRLDERRDPGDDEGHADEHLPHEASLGTRSDGTGHPAGRDRMRQEQKRARERVEDVICDLLRERGGGGRERSREATCRPALRRS